MKWSGARETGAEGESALEDSHGKPAAAQPSAATLNRTKTTTFQVDNVSVRAYSYEDFYVSNWFRIAIYLILFQGLPLL